MNSLDLSSRLTEMRSKVLIASLPVISRVCLIGAMVLSGFILHLYPETYQPVTAVIVVSVHSQVLRCIFWHMSQ